MKNILLAMVTAVMLSGCWFSLGDSVGMCEGEGCNYKNAGVCEDVITIYKNRHNLKNYKVEERWYWKDKVVE